MPGSAPLPIFMGHLRLQRQIPGPATAASHCHWKPDVDTQYAPLCKTETNGPQRHDWEKLKSQRQMGERIILIPAEIIRDMNDRGKADCTVSLS